MRGAYQAKWALVKTLGLLNCLHMPIMRHGVVCMENCESNSRSVSKGKYPDLFTDVAKEEIGIRL